ncbi:hypothetical protein F0562_008458 [Nyssa sinensis]|uniref:Uncharacterized protein n=1 Tax=Nyssa sinensis TaxID=561372 RepID=A0A5J5A7S9_9ASTE|nr:hypothetical protein F0562_008458 [Nyssa sinensis]
MEIKVENGASGDSSALEEQQQPLLEEQPIPGKPKKTPAQKAIRKTFKGTALLANLLPTGSVLAFQILSPIFTHQGKCRSIVSQSQTLGLLVTIPPEEAAKYRLKFIDFFHAFMSILVFAAVALFDQNVVKCFYPMPSEEAKELLATLPIGIGVICSLLFVAFPTKRHGIGFPLSRH